MKQRKLCITLCLLICMLLFHAAVSAETVEQTADFLSSCPPHIREMLDANGYTDVSVICGASIEREGYDERGMPTEVSTAFLVTQQNGNRSLTGLNWVIGTSNVRVESYGALGLDLSKAVSMGAVIDGSSPINRRFALRMQDGAVWEFLSTQQSSWRVYRYTGPDGFVCTLNSGRLDTASSQSRIPCSAWLGNWPDLSLFPKSETEAALFARDCWGNIGQRVLVWGANLRREPTSSSRSLGKYHVALAEVLDEKPGKQQPWYRVRIGNAEGWISGPYVETSTDVEGFSHNGSLGIPWAETKMECRLYTSMNTDDVLLALPSQTFMQVLAQTEDGWLHVLATDTPQDFSLSAPGTYGYVRADCVALHSPWNAF